MDKKPYTPIEELEFFRLFEEVTIWTWKQVVGWDSLARDTIGKQLVRAVDSINANLVEGDGRGSDTDALRFFRYARASAREARLWITRAVDRGLVNEADGKMRIGQLESGARLLGNLIKYRMGPRGSGEARELIGSYGSFEEPDDL